MASQQGDDIQELKLDVGLIKADIKTMKRDMDNNQKVIIERMDKFAFVSQTDYDRNRAEDEKKDKLRDKRIDALEKMVNVGFVKAGNTVFGNTTRIILTALSVGVIVIIVLSLASTLPAVQSALGNVQR